jgi:hypothetical protein
VKGYLEQLEYHLEHLTESGDAAQHRAHYLIEALKVALRSMEQDPERHPIALGVVKRELDQAYVMDMLLDAQRDYRRDVHRRLLARLVYGIDLLLSTCAQPEPVIGVLDNVFSAPPVAQALS